MANAGTGGPNSTPPELLEGNSQIENHEGSVHSLSNELRRVSSEAAGPIVHFPVHLESILVSQVPLQRKIPLVKNELDDFHHDNVGLQSDVDFLHSTAFDTSIKHGGDFTCFPKLSLELTRMIWTCEIMRPRAVSIAYDRG